jgi:hypothetical protein
MGLKFGCVVDDQIQTSNLEKHNQSKNLNTFGHEFTNFLPHFIEGVMVCMISCKTSNVAHQTTFTSKTKDNIFNVL